MMGGLRRRILAIVVVAALAGFHGVARASITSGAWFLNQSNTFADGTDYGTVSIVADDNSGLVEFSVDAFDVQPLYGTLNNFGIDKFAFNFENLSSPPEQWIVDLPTGWGLDENGGNADGFGSFMVTEAGPGTRLVPLLFSLTLPDPSEAIVGNFTVLSGGQAGEGSVFFAAHVAGFGSDPGSHWVGGSTPVPVPGTGVLCIAGLALAGWLNRRTA